MKSGRLAGLFVVTLAIGFATQSLRGADTPKRQPLGPREREALLALMKAVDLAQEVDAAPGDGLAWQNHILKSGDQTAYVPFRVAMSAAADGFKSTAMYVRAVSRHDGVRARDERSYIRDWVARGGDVMPRMAETVFVGPGEMPVGGMAAGSSRVSTSAPATAFAALDLQQRAYEKQKRLDEDARKKQETSQRNPLLFPFEEYYFFDLKAPHGADANAVERALSLPPGEYDVFVALVDRARVKTSSPMVLRHTVDVPDFWNDRLALGTLILAKDVHPLTAPLAAKQQAEHPYTFGQSEVIPVTSSTFAADDVLTVVFQICNYGAPDADLSAEYTFYRVDGSRRVFNHTEPQRFSDADLPPPGAWTSQAFAMQVVPLLQFPAGRYELEVVVKDRLTRASATQTVAFTVESGVR